MELENLTKVKLVRLRRPKAACSPSCADYRPNRNAEVLWDIGHTKGRQSTGGIGQGKEIKNLNVANVLKVQQ
jgi:hypothetical protein